MSNITLADVRGAVPQNLKSSVGQDVVDMLNNISSDPLVAQSVRDNFITLSSVLTEGKFQVKDFINALHYTSYILMGLPKKDSYFKTFPQRYAEMVSQNRSAKEMSAYASMYSKGKLVSLVLEKAMIPMWLQNQDIYQAAINKQFSLMNTAASEKVQQEAANSLLTHLKGPMEAASKGQINLQVNQTNIVNHLYETVRQLSEHQQTQIRGGKPVSDTMNFNIVDMVEDV